MEERSAEPIRINGAPGFFWKMSVKCEIWKDIPNYEGLYKVSNLGRIKSVPHIIKANKYGGTRITKEYIKKTNVGWHGYVWVSLSKNGKGKTHSVHSIVARAFINNSSGLKYINHIDGNKQNNNVNNLEWCTAHENQMHASAIGLITQSKKVICVETGEIYQSSGEAERKTGICGRNIRSACSGKYKTAGGYRWKWV